jgi:hypothetical protein
VPSQGDLQRALLTASDLTGFTVDSSNSDAHPGASGGCAALDSDFSSGASATAEVLLTQGATGPYLRERLRQLPVSGAAAAFAQVSSAVTTCHTFTVTDPTLGTLALTVGHLEVSTYGDATVGLRVTIKPERFPAVTLYENIVAVRVGGTFMLITHTAVNGISDELTRAATSKAHAKMRAAW